MGIRHIVICGLSGSSVEGPCFVFVVRIRGQISRWTERQSHFLLVSTDWHTVSRTKVPVIDNLIGLKQVASGEARLCDKQLSNE